MKRTLTHLILLCTLGVVCGGGGALLLHLVNPLINTSQFNGSDSSMKTPMDQYEMGAEQEKPTNFRNYLDRLKGFEELSEIKNAVELDAAVYSFVAKIPVRDLGRIFEATNSGTIDFSPNVLYKVQRALLENLAETKPEDALAYALVHDLPQHLVSPVSNASGRFIVPFAAPPSAPIQESYVSTVFAIWTRNDPIESSAAAERLEEKFRFRAFVGILESQTVESFSDLRAIAERLGSEQLAADAILATFNNEGLEDPRSAWEEISPLLASGNLFHEWVAKNVVLHWYAQDGVSIVDEILSSYVSNSFKSSTLAIVLGLAVKDSPEIAIRKALEIPTEELFRVRVVTDLMSSWTALDPEVAYRALGEIDQTSFGDSLLKAVINTWARIDPHYVLKNFENFPRELHLHARTRALTAIARSTPQQAAELTLGLTDRATRHFSLRGVLRIWMEQDLEHTIDWVVDGDSVGQQRYEIVGLLTRELAKKDPHRAFRIARNESVLSSDNTGLEANVIGVIVQHGDVETAIELLAEARAGRTRVHASLQVGEGMIRNGNVEDAVNLGLFLPESEQNKYFPRLSYVWSEVAPNELIAAIARLPSETTRSQVVKTIFESSSRENFTEAQLETLSQYLSTGD